MGVTILTVPHRENLAPPDLERVYIEHADFMWACLARLGVREADIEDVLHEVFLAVHRRLSSFTGEGSLRGWLFAFCRRAAANYRRLARLHVEKTGAAPSDFDVASDVDGPERAASVNETLDALERILATLPDDKRIVFVMFEIELMSAEEIAAVLEIPVGTVYSRAHWARRDFQRAARRLHLLPPEI